MAVLVAPAASVPDSGAEFEALDRNGDGVVTRAEVLVRDQPCDVPLAIPLRHEGLGFGPRPFAICRDQPGFTILDRDRDGLVIRDELAARQIEIRRMGFNALDRDGNETLDASEYGAVRKIVFLNKPPEAAGFRELDRNSDRRISFGEFSAQ